MPLVKGDPKTAAIARMGGLARAAKYDGHSVTAAAREAADARFERLVDPNNSLSVKERARRARAARSLWYSQLALRRHKKAQGSCPPSENPSASEMPA